MSRRRLDDSNILQANVEVESQSVGSIFLSGGGGGGGNLSVLGRQQPYLGGGAGGGTLIRGGGHLIGDNLTLAALKGNGFGGTLKSKSNNLGYHNHAYDASYPHSLGDGGGGDFNKNSPSLFHSRYANNYNISRPSRCTA